MFRKRIAGAFTRLRSFLRAPALTPAWCVTGIYLFIFVLGICLLLWEAKSGTLSALLLRLWSFLAANDALPEKLPFAFNVSTVFISLVAATIYRRRKKLPKLFDALQDKDIPCKHKAVFLGLPLSALLLPLIFFFVFLWRQHKIQGQSPKNWDFFPATIPLLFFAVNLVLLLWATKKCGDAIHNHQNATDPNMYKLAVGLVTNALNPQNYRAFISTAEQEKLIKFTGTLRRLESTATATEQKEKTDHFYMAITAKIMPNPTAPPPMGTDVDAGQVIDYIWSNVVPALFNDFLKPLYKGYAPCEKLDFTPKKNSFSCSSSCTDPQKILEAPDCLRPISQVIPSPIASNKSARFCDIVANGIAQERKWVPQAMTDAIRSAITLHLHRILDITTA